MTVVPEPLTLISNIRMDLRLGKSVSMAVEGATSGNSGHLSKALRSWLIRTEAGHVQEEILKVLPVLDKSVAYRSLVQILEKGLHGMSVDPALADLEDEYFAAAENRYEQQLQVLPLKLLLPLTLLILPGMMLLILGPVIFRLASGF